MTASVPAPAAVLATALALVAPDAQINAIASRFRHSSSEPVWIESGSAKTSGGIGRVDLLLASAIVSAVVAYVGVLGAGHAFAQNVGDAVCVIGLLSSVGLAVCALALVLRGQGAPGIQIPASVRDAHAALAKAARRDDAPSWLVDAALHADDFVGELAQVTSVEAHAKAEPLFLAAAHAEAWLNTRTEPNIDDVLTTSPAAALLVEALPNDAS